MENIRIRIIIHTDHHNWNIYKKILNRKYFLQNLNFWRGKQKNPTRFVSQQVVQGPTIDDFAATGPDHAGVHRALDFVLHEEEDLHVGKASAVSRLHELVPVGEDNPVADKSLRVGPLACLVAPVNVAAGDHPAASSQGRQDLIK